MLGKQSLRSRTGLGRIHDCSSHVRGLGADAYKGRESYDLPRFVRYALALADDVAPSAQGKPLHGGTVKGPEGEGRGQREPDSAEPDALLRGLSTGRDSNSRRPDVRQTRA